MNSVPIIISKLNPHWSVFYCEMSNTKLRRPVAVAADGSCRVQFDRRKKNCTVWVGHPVIASDKNIRYDVIDAGDGTFIIQANNPTDKSIDVTFRANQECPFLEFKPFKATINAGSNLRLVSAGTHFILKDL